MSKVALIAGVTGQDGAYLAHHLLNLGYAVHGTSRDAQMCDLSRLQKLGIDQDIKILSLALNDFRSVLKAVSSVQPQEIYNLAGQTSVGLSFDQPVECMESISVATLNLLEVIRFYDPSIRLFSAGSTETFGQTDRVPVTEDSPLSPRSPYAVAKAAAYWQISTYREAYNLFACTGILANHESALRPKRFVTQKIISGVKDIKAGRQTKLNLGNLNIWRDWGWAPDYIKAMVMMLQADSPSDYLIASGVSTSLRGFAELAFQLAGLDIEAHLVSLDEFKRPSDLNYIAINPLRAQEVLGWNSNRTISEIVYKMYHEELF